jgi:uncharacterized membrane protein YphA (DoxX/SURF4 family)
VRVNRPRAFVVTRFIVGGIFVVAGTAKVLNPESFAASIRGYRLVPEIAIAPLAHILPLIELMLGLFVLFNLFPKISLFSISVLLVTFQAALLSVIIRKLDIDCGCFGKLFEGSNHHTDNIIAVIRNFLLLGLLLIVLTNQE